MKIKLLFSILVALWLSSCTTRTHLSPTYGYATRKVFEAQSISQPNPSVASLTAQDAKRVLRVKDRTQGNAQGGLSGSSMSGGGMGLGGTSGMLMPMNIGFGGGGGGNTGSSGGKD